MPPTGTDADFDADAMIGDLNELLRQNRDEFRAAAVVCDITLLEEDSDAIHVAAEHRDGSLFAAVLPYAANPATRELEFGRARRRYQRARRLGGLDRPSCAMKINAFADVSLRAMMVLAAASGRRAC